MSRLSHKKSRRGCQRCKQRHIKCDETKPACLKCVAGELRCPYLDNATSPPTPASIDSSKSTHLVRTPTSSSSVPGSTITSFASLSSFTAPPTHGVLNMLHLELFQHAQSSGGLNAFFHINAEALKDINSEMFSFAFSTPYLMHVLLSLSALHLSVLHPSQKDYYVFHSTELQTYALSLFNTTTIDENTHFIPPFLFASLLGSHLLYDAISPPSNLNYDDFSSFLDRFVNYLRIAKGVQTQISGAKWVAFSESSFHTFVANGSLIPPPSTATAPELDTLESLLQTADISPSSLEIYMQALRHLKSAYAAQRVEGEATGISGVFAWPIVVGNEYTDLLEQRRPEALVVLAYYGAVLWGKRHVWVFGQGGGRVVEFVRGYLGGAWDGWLEYPKGVIEGVC